MSLGYGADNIETEIQAVLSLGLDLRAWRSVQRAVYEVSWELPIFMTAHMPSRDQIKTALTVTGGLVTAYAATCEEYIAFRWGTPARLLLRALEQMLKNGNIGNSSSLHPNM
jgi:hypothetical protein